MLASSVCLVALTPLSTKGLSSQLELPEQKRILPPSIPHPNASTLASTVKLWPMEAHRVLGVAKDASEEQIRKAYKALAMTWHPDRRLQEKEEATEMFVEIHKASRTLLRNLRRGRRSPRTGTSTPSDSTQSSPRSPPAALTKSDTFQSTHSDFSIVSGPAPSFSSLDFSGSSSSPSLSAANSEHRGHPLTSSPLAQDFINLPTEDPVDSGPPASPNRASHNRLKKHSKQSSTRSSSDQYSTLDFTPSISSRKNASRHDLGHVVETLCPGRAILSGSGADSPKKWVHVLYMTLEELFHGKVFHFRILRYTQVGKKRAFPIDIHIPPGARAGTEILVKRAGHENKDGKYQDISFVIKERNHPRFTRVYDDLLMEVKLPWLDCLSTEVAQVYLRSVDEQDYAFPIDYRSDQLLNGTTVIPDAGMPRRNGVGRGRIVVKWEIASPSSSGWDSIKATLGYKSSA